MAYDVASSINDLLFKNQSVIIPGFGGFVLNEHSANIDYIKSTISPPSKIPSFNKNLTLNDGILVDYIKNQNRCTLEQAKQIVQDFVQEAEKKIESKEILEFPKVGRLYKDYSKSLQFLPYDTNFNTNAFGLPVIEVHPFSRNNNSASTATTAATASTTMATEATTETAVLEQPAAVTNNTTVPEEEKVATIPLGDPKRKGIFRWAQMTLPLLFIASLFVIGLSWFLLRDGGNSKTVKGNTAASLTAGGEEKKINTAPSIEEAEITPITDADDIEESHNLGEDYISVPEDGDPESVDYNSSSESDDFAMERECIVIVGQFSSKGNANRFVEQIENNGYESYMGWNNEKGWNTVGVRFSYDSESEKDRMHQKLKNEYDNSAWILRD